jgi:chromosome segregation ATPase
VARQTAKDLKITDLEQQVRSLQDNYRVANDGWREALEALDRHKQALEQLQQSNSDLRGLLKSAMQGNDELGNELRMTRRELQGAKQQLDSAVQHIEEMEQQKTLDDAAAVGEMKGVQRVYREMLDRTEAKVAANDVVGTALGPLMESLSSPSGLMAMLGGRRR